MLRRVSHTIDNSIPGTKQPTLQYCAARSAACITYSCSCIYVVLLPVHVNVETHCIPFESLLHRVSQNETFFNPQVGSFCGKEVGRCPRLATINTAVGGRGVGRCMLLYIYEHVVARSWWNKACRSFRVVRAEMMRISYHTRTPCC